MIQLDTRVGDDYSYVSIPSVGSEAEGVQIDRVLEFLLQLLTQFAGGPGPMENNLVRFGLPAMFWGSLLVVAWLRQRDQDLPREKLLVWGFGLGAASALLMAAFTALQMLEVIVREAAYGTLVPLDRALAMASTVVVAGAFLRYILDDAHLARRYLWVGLMSTTVCLAVALWQWPSSLAAGTEVRFHATWGAWLFHVLTFFLIVAAIIPMRRRRSWLCNVVCVALGLLLVSEALLLVNYATNRTHSHVFCPIGNSLRILAIPLFGYVYLREQALEKRKAEESLRAYRHHLEDLVSERTTDLTAVNVKLEQKIREQEQAEEALSQLSGRYELILESAGEGIFGIDNQGRFTFVNPAAARMLGYGVDELVGRAAHRTLHPRDGDHGAYPDDDCPIALSYARGIARQGDDLVFRKRDDTTFPVLYVSSPSYKAGELTGAVVVFRDITERKQAEAEIAQRNARLAAQNAVAATLSRTLDLEAMLDDTVDVVLSVLDMHVGLVFLWDPEVAGLVLRSARGEVTRDETAGHQAEWTCCLAISMEALTGAKVVVRAVSDYEGSQPGSNIVREGLETLISAPLVSKGRAVGALTLGARRTQPVGKTELELVTAIGQQIGMALENARLYAQAEHAAEVLTRLHQASIVLTSTFDAARIYEQIAEQSAKLTGCQAGWIVAQGDNPGRTMELVASHGLSETARDVVRSQGETLAVFQGRATRDQSLAIGDATADPLVPSAWAGALSVRAMLCVPIWGADAPRGFLFLADRRAPRRWRAEELELIESFVNRAAVALMNADLHKRLEWAAVLEERQRIAANMHDGLAQMISLLGLRVDEVTDLVARGSAKKAAEVLPEIRETIGQIGLDVRRSIASFHEIPRPRRSLQDLLSDLPGQLAVGEGPEVDLVFGIDEPLYLPQDQAAEAVLVAQEALVNACRHANARRITLRLGREGGEAAIAVEDDGRGFDPSTWWRHGQGHFGLSIMHARAARIGARLLLDSAPGKGTRVVLTVPLDDVHTRLRPSMTQPDAAHDRAPGQEVGG